jgi:hypothetical protein
MRRPASAFAQESVNGAAQLWQVLLDDRRDDVQIDAEVVTNDLVAQPRNLLPQDVRLACLRPVGEILDR